MSNTAELGRAQSFVAGDPVNIQLMVKDSTKWAATGSWGFAQFDKDGKPNLPEAALKSGFPCHEPGKAGDFVFTHSRVKRRRWVNQRRQPYAYRATSPVWLVITPTARGGDGLDPRIYRVPSQPF
jgi:hypothetical protein